MNLTSDTESNDRYHMNGWVMIKMTYNDKVIYKVLGGSESRRYLNSNISKIVKYENSYKFYGSSGCYICPTDSYGLIESTVDIWETMKSTYPKNVELMNDCDWANFDLQVN